MSGRNRAPLEVRRALADATKLASAVIERRDADARRLAEETLAKARERDFARAENQRRIAEASARRGR